MFEHLLGEVQRAECSVAFPLAELELVVRVQAAHLVGSVHPEIVPASLCSTLIYSIIIQSIICFNSYFFLFFWF